MTLPICVGGITELAGKETEYLDWNLLVPMVWPVLYKHTAAGCLCLRHIELTGIIWNSSRPLFPKSLLHDFEGKYSTQSFKEMLEMCVPRKTFIYLFVCLLFAASAT